MRILIADDEAISLKLLESQLRKWGYEVVATRDGAQAWEVLAGEGSPGLAILDWQMPGADGLELCRRIRQLAREPYVYVILLTARNRSEDVVAGLEAGWSARRQRRKSVPRRLASALARALGIEPVLSDLLIDRGARDAERGRCSADVAGFQAQHRGNVVALDLRQGLDRSARRWLGLGMPGLGAELG
jgi:CheY-like chemotaxis protein